MLSKKSDGFDRLKIYDETNSKLELDVGYNQNKMEDKGLKIILEQNQIINYINNQVQSQDVQACFHN